MKRVKRISALLIAMLMVFSMQMGAFAEVSVQETAQPFEQPSDWALESVQFAAIYGLAPQEMFSAFSANISREELYTACVMLYEKIAGQEIEPVEESPFTDDQSTVVLKACAAGIVEGSGKLEPQKMATRLEVVAGLYNTIKGAQPDFDFDTDIKLTYNDVDSLTDGQTDIVKYAVAADLLKGKGNNTLALMQPCTRQELFIFIKKAYEFVVYELGNDSKGIFWEIKDQDSTVYLLGSVHVANPEMYPLSKAIMNGYEKSDILVVEADITNQAEGIAYMQQKMMYAGDDTLKQNIPAEVYERFVEVVEPLGIPEIMYNKFKPWYAAMLVQSLQISDSYSSGLGIDLFFISRANAKKEIIEIEGLKFQVDMFDSFSKELQIQYLAGALHPDASVQEQQVQRIDQTIDLWKKGDSAGLGEELDTEEGTSPEAKEFNAKVWTTRDDNMAEKVKEYLADPENKTYFVVVGAGHVVGEGGIISQLKDQYEMKQLR